MHVHAPASMATAIVAASARTQTAHLYLRRPAGLHALEGAPGNRQKGFSSLALKGGKDGSKGRPELEVAWRRGR